jgi:hypothetical protein
MEVLGFFQTFFDTFDEVRGRRVGGLCLYQGAEGALEAVGRSAAG